MQTTTCTVIDQSINFFRCDGNIYALDYLLKMKLKTSLKDQDTGTEAVQIETLSAGNFDSLEV